MIDLKQKELYDWQNTNFPSEALKKFTKNELIKIIKNLQMALGLCEEAGEIAHHVLKATQGIRGGVNGINKEQLGDGVADVLVFGQQLLSQNDINAEEVIDKTINEVLERDWKKNPTGTNAGEPIQLKLF